MEPRIEILAPAGSYESLQTAVHAGADAVYIGGTLFGARAFADNPEEDVLLTAIDYVHLHGRKLYLTVNTLLKQEELTGQLYDYLLPYYKRGLDAVIVQDVGVLRFIRREFPDLDIHASTQMTVTGVSGAQFLKEQGVTRVVTARELSVKEVADIAGATGLEIESFVHGALCYCYSGQCLLSSMIGGRSGNRGQCAQPCRMPYQAEGMKQPEHLMSLKDICTLEILPELIEAGIFSFKIEGRMKKPEYVAAVTSLYRKYADLYLKNGKKGYRVAEEDREILLDIYNRGGFHTGYYHTRNGREMVSLKRPNHAGLPAVKITAVQGKLITGTALVPLHQGDVLELSGRGDNYTLGGPAAIGERITLKTKENARFSRGQTLNRIRNEMLLEKMRREYVLPQIQEKINGILMLSPGHSAKLIVECGSARAEVSGDTPEQAKKQPLTEERLRKQMLKTGNTPFVFETLDIRMEGESFFPVQSLNDLRRRALEMLEETILKMRHREAPRKYCVPEEVQKPEKERSYGAGAVKEIRRYTSFGILAETMEQFRQALREECVKRIYLDCTAVKEIWKDERISFYTAEAKENKKEIYLAMPQIFRSFAEQLYESGYGNLFRSGFDGILVRNLESIDFLKKHDYTGTVIADHNLYQFNREAQYFWEENGLLSGTAPLELNFRELKQVDMSRLELVVYGYLPVMTSAQCIRKTTGGCTHRSGQMNITDRFRKPFLVKNQCDYCYNVIYNTDPLVLTGQLHEIRELGAWALRLNFTCETGRQMHEVIELYRQAFLEEKPAEPGFAYTRGHFKRGIK